MAWWLVIACLAACGDSNASDEPITGVAGAASGAGANAGSIAAGAGTSSAGVATAGVPAQAGASAGGGGAAGSSGAAGTGAPGSDAGRGGNPPQARAGTGAAGRAAGSGAGGGAAAGGSGNAGAGGVAAAGGSGGAAGDAMCPMHGAITYKLARSMSPTAAEQDAYDKISAAMDKALSIYNCYTNITWAVNVQYVPSVQTADGNTNGSIRFGSAESMNYITAMHETSHTLGVGGAKYKTLIVGGIFTGAEATRALREVTGDPAAELHGDQQHFWPYGLNYTSEVKGMEDLIRHCRIVTGMRKDLGY